MNYNDKLIDFIFDRTFGIFDKKFFLAVAYMACLISTATYISDGVISMSVKIAILAVSAVLSFIIVILCMMKLKAKRYFILTISSGICCEIIIFTFAVDFYSNISPLDFRMLYLILFPIMSAKLFDNLFMKKASCEKSKNNLTAMNATVSAGMIIPFIRFFAAWLNGTFSPQTVTILLLLGCALLSSAFSIFFVDIHRLYCLIKLEKQGVDLSQLDPFSEVEKAE